MRLLFIFLIGYLNIAKADTWDNYNNPSNMDLDKNYVYDLNQLPTSATLRLIPWSESYWPSYKGSINYRWNSIDKDGFYYIPYSKSELLKLSLDELKSLSPAEKYDVFMGNYDYPLYHEVRSYGNPHSPDWHGICDGWSIAAIQYAEPNAVVLVNPDGILVPFGSSDVKGLMSFAAATHFKVQTKQVGTKCRWSSLEGACSDINAGAMHVVLANQIGLKKQPLITEIEPGSQIWNQPTFGFEFKILGSALTESAFDAVKVHGTLKYTDELEDSSWLPVVGTDLFKSDKIEMDYILELDSNHKIVGGYWINGSKHPDFIWLPINKLEFKGSLAGINRIYQQK